MRLLNFYKNILNTNSVTVTSSDSSRASVLSLFIYFFMYILSLFTFLYVSVDAHVKKQAEHEPVSPEASFALHHLCCILTVATLRGVSTQDTTAEPEDSFSIRFNELQSLDSKSQLTMQIQDWASDTKDNTLL